MKKLIAIVAVLGTLYGVAGSLSLSSTTGAVANAQSARAATIDAATNGN